MPEKQKTRRPVMKYLNDCSRGSRVIWSILLHLGGNMWNEEGNPRDREHDPDSQASSVLRFSRPLWRRYLERLKACGVNMILLDLGEGLRYESHPELAVEGSWTRDEMAAELGHMRDMGFEVVPKLNFSACHDIWMKEPRCGRNPARGRCGRRRRIWPCC